MAEHWESKLHSEYPSHTLQAWVPTTIMIKISSEDCTNWPRITHNHKEEDHIVIFSDILTLNIVTIFCDADGDQVGDDCKPVEAMAVMATSVSSHQQFGLKAKSKTIFW